MNQLTFVYDGTTAYIYVNGILTKSVNIDNNDLNLIIKIKLKDTKI